jgi:hypothetical protein
MRHGQVYWAFLTILLSVSIGSGQAVRLDPVPTGVEPVGIDISATTTDFFPVVANSGDNSVSVFRLTSLPGRNAMPKMLTPVVTVRGIPGPYSIASCGAQGFQGVVGSTELR